MASKEIEARKDFFRNRKTTGPVTIEQQRQGINSRMAQNPLPAGTILEEVDLNGIHAEKYVVPNADESSVFLYIHGGGFTHGSCMNGRFFGTHVALVTKQVVYSIDYRMFPEYHHPAGLEDCVKAYQAILDMGIEPQKITISGDSAGGQLTLATTLWLKDHGIPLPGSVVLGSPFTGFGIEDAPDEQSNYDVMLQKGTINRLQEGYFEGADIDSPYVSPYKGDFTGFPPTFLTACTDEVLSNHFVELTRILAKHRVDCVLRYCADLFHSYIIAPTEESDLAAQEVGNFILRYQGKIVGKVDR